MKTYSVCIAVHGYINIVVDAENEDEAEWKATEESYEVDFGNLQDVECKAVYTEQENDIETKTKEHQDE